MRSTGCHFRICVLVYVLAALPLASPQEGTRSSGTDGFRAIRLGMSLEEVKKALQEDPYFSYRGDPDVSFLPLTQQTLIECTGTSFIARAYFQFHEGRLYVITLDLDPSRIDHYSLFTQLANKYGPYAELSPWRVLWRFADVDFSLERPLTVKYIDRRTFEDLRSQGAAKEALDDIDRRRFLEQF